jgi:hypothetical protein
MTDNQLRERNIINVMSSLTWCFTQGSMTNGDKDLVKEYIRQLTILLNEFKIDNNIELSDTDLWED